MLLKIRGECEILGVKFTNTFILYNNNKHLPIEKGKDSIITLKKNSRYVFPKRNTEQDQSKIGTKIWGNIIKSILKSNRKRIIIIGPSDTGKSTLTLFLANKLIRFKTTYNRFRYRSRRIITSNLHRSGNNIKANNRPCRSQS